VTHPLASVIDGTVEVLRDAILKSVESESLTTDELHEVQSSLHAARSYLNTSETAVLQKLKESR